jgi:hypothetical protein
VVYCGVWVVVLWGILVQSGALLQGWDGIGAFGRDLLRFMGCNVNVYIFLRGLWVKLWVIGSEA